MTVIFHNISPSFLWSTSYILQQPPLQNHAILHPIILILLQNMPIISMYFCCSTVIISLIYCLILSKIFNSSIAQHDAVIIHNSNTTNHISYCLKYTKWHFNVHQISAIASKQHLRSADTGTLFVPRTTTTLGMRSLRSLAHISGTVCQLPFELQCSLLWRSLDISRPTCLTGTETVSYTHLTLPTILRV